MTNLQVSSFFNQVWKDCTLDLFVEIMKPANDQELTNLLNVIRAGKHVLSPIGTFKFRARPDAGSEPAVTGGDA